MLYTSVVKLQYNSSEEECKRVLHINCKVGQKDIIVVDTDKMCSNLQGKLY